MLLIALTILVVLTLVLAVMYADKKAKRTGGTTMGVLFSLNVVTLTALLVLIIVGTIMLYTYVSML